MIYIEMFESVVTISLHLGHNHTTTQLTHDSSRTAATGNFESGGKSILHPEEQMDPEKWYTADFQIVENNNKRGAWSLLFRDYKYIKADQNKLKGTRSWRCTKKHKSCLARVTTRGHNQLKINKHLHNHSPFVEMQQESVEVPFPVPELVAIKCEPVEFDESTGGD